MQNINKKVLVLCYYSLCWSVLASQFRSDSSPIPASYAKIFPPSSNVDYLRSWPWRACTRWTNGRGWGITQVAKNCLRMCAQNYHLSSVFIFFVIARVQSSGGCLRPSSPCRECVVQSRKGGKCEVRQETKSFCAGARETILARNLLRQS